MSAKGGRARSAAKTAANREKLRVFWDAVRRGESPPPRRHRLTPQLANLAKRLVWWERPVETLRYPLRFAARVMDLGTPADCEIIDQEFGKKVMLSAVRRAEAGWFRERSWYYWHYRLGLTPWGGEPPPLPARAYGA